MQDRSSRVNDFLVEVISKSGNFPSVETELLVPDAQSDANKELAERIRLIYREYDHGLKGFFDAVESEQRALEAAANRAKEARLRRLFQQALLTGSSELSAID